MLAGDLNVALAQSDSGAAAKPSSASSTKADGRVRLNMQGASWKKALRRIARHGGIELVMKATPPGTFSCADAAEHSVPEALRIVNRQLEPLGYRASQQGSFLVVLNLDSLRSGYNSPSFIRPRQDPTVAAAQAPAAPTAAAGAAPTTTDAVQVSANAPRQMSPRRSWSSTLTQTLATTRPRLQRPMPPRNTRSPRLPTKRKSKRRTTRRKSESGSSPPNGRRFCKAFATRVD